MKRYKIVLISIIFAACSSQTPTKWNEAQKKQFIENCSVTFKEGIGAEKVSKYCDCLMEKMQEKGIKAEESNKIPTEIMHEAAEDCGL